MLGSDEEAVSARHSETEPWGGECQKPKRKVERGTVLSEVGSVHDGGRGGGPIDSERSRMLGEGSTGRGTGFRGGEGGWD